MSGNTSTVRCAIYTRKSSEEGLEQSFNSLDAQREACHAFILSQRQEGWKVLPALYDDGGYSGGTMMRPALQRLMKDVEEHEIDTIVVYKVDRLTRSLADFAKIVEGLDARGVSFVSVTQQFNTTSSMGRLTLNVLLSFAQFEREVTGERIRDKIAASKKKGMWMGGRVPLGYDVEGRKLLVNAGEARFVCDLYRRYLKLGCVSKLKIQLDEEGVQSKVRVSAGGRHSGGTSYSRGALYQVLKSRIYLGEVPHRDQSYKGEHQSIVPVELWQQVQARLKRDHQGRRNGIKADSPSLLTGLLQDPKGNRFTPSHTLKNKKRYRYYVCQSKRMLSPQTGPSRIPAYQIESLALSRLRSFLGSENDLLDELRLSETSVTEIKQVAADARNASNGWLEGDPDQVRRVLNHLVDRITIQPDRIEIFVARQNLRTVLLNGLETVPIRFTRSKGKARPDDLLCLTIDARFNRSGGETRLLVAPRPGEEIPTNPASSLLKAIARSRDWYDRLIQGEAEGQESLAKETELDERYASRILRCAFLAPDIVEAILEGRQPQNLGIERLLKPISLNWAEQRRQLGFPAHP